MRGINTCCPETVPTVNVYQNVVEMDGTRAFWAEKYLTGAQYKAVGWIQLDYVAYTRSQCTLILNSGVQRQPNDFVVSGDKVYLSFVPQDGDLIHFKYFALTDGTSNVVNDSSLPTGSMIGFSGATIPDGWLEMDGTTPHPRAAYAALVVWLTANPDYLHADSDDTNFVLKALNTPYYDGTTLVVGKTIIRT